MSKLSKIFFIIGILIISLLYSSSISFAATADMNLSSSTSSQSTSTSSSSTKATNTTPTKSTQYSTTVSAFNLYITFQIFLKLFKFYNIFLCISFQRIIW